ncbi:transposase, partial [Candidatus Pacearchaeota archaeon]|nr:transposase [Candidatus Pacearchaeota archaeon]
GHTNNQCRKIILAQFGYEINIRTLRRWTHKLNQTEWDLKDKSKRPKRVYTKLTPEIEEKIIKIRNQTGWGENKISNFIPNISHKIVNKILNKHGLTNPNPNRKKRIKYIRWQRKHPNSLWQMDTSDQKIEGKYCFAVIDDCSRYCLGLFGLNRVSTNIIIHLHIRTAIHSPTTSGKIERFFQTLDKEFAFCNKDAECFRMRYNHFRPHTSLENKTPSQIYFDFSKLI